MPGGQKGLSFIGEPMMYATVATALLCVVIGVVGCDDVLPQADPTPVEQHQTDCQQAWADSQSGQADEADEQLLGTEFCDQAVAAAVAEAELRQQQELQEARADAGQSPSVEEEPPAGTPVEGPEVLAVVEEDGTVRPLP
jgi:hypothetical protein